MADSKVDPKVKKPCTHEGEEKFAVRAKGDKVGFFGKLKWARRRYGPLCQHAEAGDPFPVFKCQFSEKWMEKVKPALSQDGRQIVNPVTRKPEWVAVDAPVVAAVVNEDENQALAEEKAELAAVTSAAPAKPAK